jgi:hypothetical protein
MRLKLHHAPESAVARELLHGEEVGIPPVVLGDADDTVSVRARATRSRASAGVRKSSAYVTVALAT